MSHRRWIKSVRPEPVEGRPSTPLAGLAPLRPNGFYHGPCETVWLLATEPAQRGQAHDDGLVFDRLSVGDDLGADGRPRDEDLGVDLVEQRQLHLVLADARELEQPAEPLIFLGRRRQLQRAAQ